MNKKYDISKEFVSNLLLKIDICDIINQYLPIKKVSGNNFFSTCPFHSEKTPSFSVNKKSQFYHCFGCGISGNVITFLMDFCKYSFIESIEYLAKKADISIPLYNGNIGFNNLSNNKLIFSLIRDVANIYQNEIKTNKIARKYLNSRNITPETIDNFLIGVATNNSKKIIFDKFKKNEIELLVNYGVLCRDKTNGYFERFFNRIIFPVRNKSGSILGFGGRQTNENEKNFKYINSTDSNIFHKSSILYGIYEAKQNRANENFLVVEGYFDVITLHQAGIHNVVSTMGTAVTKEHIIELFNNSIKKNITFCFDGDNAGILSYWKIIELVLPIINDDHSINFVFLPKEYDPDSFILSFGRDKFITYIKDKSKSIIEAFFVLLTKKLELTSIDDNKISFINNAITYISKINAILYRNLFLQELQNFSQIEFKQLEKKLYEFKAIEGKKILNKSNFTITNNSNEKLEKVFINNKISPIKIIAELLVKFPEFEKYIDDDVLNLNVDGIELLKILIKFIRENNNINSSLVLENWRNDGLFKIINFLIKKQNILNKECTKTEFHASINKLKKTDITVKIEELLEKYRKFKKISKEEEANLAELIKIKNNFKN